MPPPSEILFQNVKALYLLEFMLDGEEFLTAGAKTALSAGMMLLWAKSSASLDTLQKGNFKLRLL